MGRRAEQASLLVKALRDEPAAKRQLLDQKMQLARRAHGVYRLAFDRWKQSIPGAYPFELTLRDRLAVGLGQDTVLEVGITLHHTYRTPLIRGSAIKGLAAHYCDRVWGHAEPRFKLDGESYRVLFGDTANGAFITYHDAWITPASLIAPNRGLALDVMTPHHGPYYMSSDETAPTDFDDPNPVSFLSVSGSFLFLIECADTGKEGAQWAGLAVQLLKQALSTWGAGGKTNAGYGRFNP